MILTIDLRTWYNLLCVLLILFGLIAFCAVGIACFIQHLGKDGDLERARKTLADASLPSDGHLDAPPRSRVGPAADSGRRRHRRPSRQDSEVSEDVDAESHDSSQR